MNNLRAFLYPTAVPSLDQFLRGLKPIKLTRNQMIARMEAHGWKVWVARYDDSPNVDIIEATGPHFLGRLQMPVPPPDQEHDHRLDAIYCLLMAHVKDALNLHGNA